MPSKLTTASAYKTLVKRINTELAQLEFFVKRRTAESYWRVGKFIYEHLLEHKDRADYGALLFEALAQDVDRSKSTLYSSVQFYRDYPILHDRGELSWNHFKCLLTVKDAARRRYFEGRAVTKGWNYLQLQEAIRLEHLKSGKFEDKRPAGSPGEVFKLSVTRCALNTYRILEPAYIHSEIDSKVVDLGFSTNIQAEMILGADLKEGDIIETKKTGAKFSFIRSEVKPKGLYAYVALVERVVDADTVWLNVDLGFKVWTRQKIRLRGIDAPEIITTSGKKAKEFVEVRLKDLPFVVIKTYKDDKYGRFLGDIFYLAGTKAPQSVLAEGIFLNQELLDQRLAVVMKK